MTGLSIRAGVGALALLAVTLSAGAQTNLPGLGDQRLTVAQPLTHFVSGRIQMVACSQPLTVAGVQVLETFLLDSGNGLQIPTSRSPSGGYGLDRLVVGGSALEQNRVLGSSGVAADGTFRVGWAEPRVIGLGPKVPWIENVQHISPSGTRSVTAYRVLRVKLTLAVPPPQPGQIWHTSFAAEPFITFFGAETSKEVGLLKASCSGFSF
jgi:hypothetical protein